MKPKQSENIIYKEKGLLAGKQWQPFLQHSHIGVVCMIRNKLKQIPGISEKFNVKSLYFGYWVGDEKDRIYIYVRIKHLTVDIDLPIKYDAEIRRQGFEIKKRRNYQGRAGWLTGWRIPYTTQKDIKIVKWLRRVFETKSYNSPK